MRSHVGSPLKQVASRVSSGWGGVLRSARGPLATEDPRLLLGFVPLFPPAY